MAYLWIIEMAAAISAVLGYATVALFRQRGHWTD
jgi:hypothetical protein